MSALHLLDEPMRFDLRDWCAEAGVALPPGLGRSEADAILAALENALWQQVVVEWNRQLPVMPGARLDVLRVPEGGRADWKRQQLGGRGPVAEPLDHLRRQVHHAARARVDVAGIVAAHLRG